VEPRARPLPELVTILRPRLLPVEVPATPVPGLRPAATLILLHASGGEPSILFTRRSDTVSSHKGQISFPGGGYEVQDASLAQTALRETWEEIGIPPATVRLIGRLPDLPSISFFQVVPFVGATEVPFELLHDPREVAEVIDVPVRHLLQPGVFSREPRLFEGRPVPTYSYEYDGHVIWGLTARFLREFLDTLND
jgi:8-oxo-dGTP pyrophosphatase MutT (NUDIX family)